jgi:hypothetical protein
MIRIGVIRGGTGPEYSYSLEAGRELLSIITETLKDSHRAVDIVVTRDGLWHIKGREVDVGDVISATDILIPLLASRHHAGQFSLSEIRLPVLTPNIVHPVVNERALSVADLARHPDFENTEKIVSHVATVLPPPWLIRIPGQSLPYQTITTREKLANVFSQNFSKILSGTIESLAFGEDIAVLVSDNFRGEHPYAFPPVVLGTYGFSGFTLSKPRILRGTQAEELIEQAKNVYLSLGLRHLASIHFTRAKDGMHLGAVEANPLLHPLRYMPIALEAVGSHMPEFLKHIVGLTQKK